MTGSDPEQPPPTHHPYGENPPQDPAGGTPPSQNPYEQQNPYQQNPYEQNPYGATPPPYQQQSSPQGYGQSYGDQSYGQQPYGQPYGQQPYGYPQPASHPSSTTAMVLGIIGLAGILACGGVTLVLSPFAWIMGGRAVREIDAAPPGTYRGREQANAGRIMGIIGTILLIIGVVLAVGLIALFVVGASSTSTRYDSGY